jgi:septum formation protein
MASAAPEFHLPELILASASPRRSSLLREMGFNFAVVRSEAPEVASEFLSPAEIAQVNAYRKARQVAKKHPDVLVLAADTVVSLGREHFGKPRSLQEAEAMLIRLQGRTHQVVTGICLLHLRLHRQRLFAETTLVTFRQLQVEQIRQYLARIHPLDKAGGYAIQDEGDEIVKSIQGSFSNVVGLPLERLRQELSCWL